MIKRPYMSVVSGEEEDHVGGNASHGGVLLGQAQGEFWKAA